MDNLSTSLILLVLALVLLWLAVTDRLSRVLDAYDVLRGQGTKAGTAATAATAALTQYKVRLPSLPELGQNVQVPA